MADFRTLYYKCRQYILEIDPQDIKCNTIN